MDTVADIDENNMDSLERRMKWVDMCGLVFWTALCFSAALSGTAFPVDAWYAELQRPSIAPPNWIFGPVWTVLYLMMAVASWLIWRRDGFYKERVPLILFVCQLILNAAWSWLFFGLHRMDLAFLEIIALFVTIAITASAFFRRNRLAGTLLIPYLLWVGFATLLNFEFWRFNS
jgi:tryptophan-rich sensory protein